MVIKLKLRWILMLCMAVVILTGMIYLLFFTPQETIAFFPMQNQTIVLDAGHGGLDGGASTDDGVLEKAINLNIAKYLEAYLKQSGATVVMTRTKDISLHTSEEATVKQRKREDLLKRREITNTSGADLMISIHMNYFEQKQYSGAQVFYEQNFAESKALASAIQKSLKENLNSENKREVQTIPKNKLQFQCLSVPSALVECGFLSNKEEAAMLKTSEYQQKVALAIYMGILQYYN